ncbi:MAG: UbiA-like polyprenyltransferase [Acidobacteriota bacterium]|nr:putative 4-hydroxybenzoate polyprenyltransferase [Blastocatellia bacterium]MDW8413422.1 UbiA-like polyprenyltransferase [Acidobacteriota bacterium]
MLKSLRTTLEMIKIEHTLFALPFALLGAFLAASGIPPLGKLFWIAVCMVGARSAAMAFNRLVDERYDAANPRTRKRALPAGLVSRRFVMAFTIISSAVFLIGAAMLNRLTLLLSPVALASILLYSYTKRFTALCHLVLGWCLAMAPMGAWIAIRGEFEVLPLVLSAVVMLWTAGFDIIYSCQDYEFDLRTGLYSIPQRLGIARALWVSRALHLCVFGLLVSLYWLAELSWPGIVGIALAAALLLRQHWLVKADDLSRLDTAFFSTNALLSVILFVAIGADLLLRGQ